MKEKESVCLNYAQKGGGGTKLKPPKEREKKARVPTLPAKKTWKQEIILVRWGRFV